MTTTVDDIWKILAELAQSQKETERILREQSLETERRFQETERRFQQSDRIFQELTKEVNKQISAVNKQISSLGGKWGRFVENMVAPSCETIFLNRGIDVHQVSQRVRKRVNGDTLEIDVLVTNQDAVLVVEVKSSLGVEDVKELMKDLRRFRHFFPEYEQKRLYGAVAGIEIEDSADTYAYKQGLFVLAQKGEAVSILNKPEFEPRVW